MLQGAPIGPICRRPAPWTLLTSHVRESISFILTAVEPDGALETHVSFQGEPFMVQVTGQDVVRYILHVQALYSERRISG